MTLEILHLPHDPWLSSLAPSLVFIPLSFVPCLDDMRHSSQSIPIPNPAVALIHADIASARAKLNSSILLWPRKWSPIFLCFPLHRPLPPQDATLLYAHHS